MVAARVVVSLKTLLAVPNSAAGGKVRPLPPLLALPELVGFLLTRLTRRADPTKAMRFVDFDPQHCLRHVLHGARP